MTEFMFGLITGFFTAFPWAVIIIAVMDSKGKRNDS